ncbi:unnamed protein product, partial [Mesorhabditis belari]|uniref:CCT-gamma n=1 Tax=Mesorhabditis belari TaxID=2138241 RepID=A0AAF3FN05_9BILA
MRGGGQQPVIVLFSWNKTRKWIPSSNWKHRCVQNNCRCIVMTNDGNAILREITVKHPAAKSMIDIARTQDEETGDGTTSVIVLAGEIMSKAHVFLEQRIHPTIIIQAYQLTVVVKSCLGTKMLAKWMDLAVNIALDAVQTIRIDKGGVQDIDIKRYCRIEKIPGGTIEDSRVVKGVVLNKDVTHPKMKRRIENPRIILLDCNLEYKKGESQTSLEIMREEDITRILEQAGITAIRRLKKTDNNRLARVCGARIVNETCDLREEDVGLKAELFEITKIGDEYYTYVTSSQTTAVTVCLRGPSKDIINEVERNLNDAVNVVRNVLLNPRLVPGGGALEMALSHALHENSRQMEGSRKSPYDAAALALEVIPRTLIQNCGGNTIRQITALRAKHAQGPENWTWGIDGSSGDLVDMNKLGVWDPLSVRIQVLKTAVETSVMLLRIDDIVSGTKKSTGEERKEIMPE